MTTTDDGEDIPEGKRFCFLNSVRPCEAECLAFMAYEPEGKDYERQQWAHCMILVNMHKAGKHVVALAQHTSQIVLHADSLLRFLKIKKADEARGGPLPPPRGG